MIFAVICGLRRLVRYDLLAAFATAVLMTMAEGDVVRETGMRLLIFIALYLALYMFIAYLLMRVGLVATISLMFFINGLNALWLGMDWKAWYAPYGFGTFLLLLGIAGFAFWRAQGHRERAGSGEELSAARSRA